MRFEYALQAALFGTTAALVIMQPPIANALTSEEVQTIAQQITVTINPGARNAGSGFIIARDGNTYYVLTARHVVENLDGYLIMTGDGERYTFEQDEYSTRVRKIYEKDLAVVQFTSDRDYPTARLGNYDLQRRENVLAGRTDLVFVSGTPGAGQQVEQAPVEGDRLLSPGLRMPLDMASGLAKQSIQEGYQLFYTSDTYPGMSGGPVLDSNGRVIGVHGRSEGEFLAEPESGSSDFRVKAGFSQGIPISIFLDFADEVGIERSQLTLESTAPTPLEQQDVGSLESLFIPKSGLSDSREWVNHGNKLWRLANLYQYYGDSQSEQLKQRAFQAYNKAVELSPNFYQAWYGRGNLLFELGELNDALSSYSRAIEIFPYEEKRQEHQSLVNPTNKEENDRLNALNGELGFYATLWRYKGIILSKLRRHEEAVQAFNRVNEIQEMDYISWDLRGMSLLALGENEGALESFDQALLINPDEYSHAWIHRGLALGAMNNLEEAIQAYNRGIEIQPNTYQTWMSRASLINTFLQQNQDDPSALDRALAIQPDEAYAWHRRGWGQLSLQNHQDAIAAFDRAIVSNPEDAAAWTAKGMTLLMENRYDEAADAFAQAHKLDPNNTYLQEVRDAISDLNNNP
ncbi:tetratricopeptide repeat-containing serine protease family protein [Oscillatoria sp. HE19RPO]|uniref:tetratricopeptide repeat-containing S1 family peptidase n=1 Tax=Oscillatoria sp. HE19RPO TaxID=2954806 RepID=UPI0020C5A6C4|nr:tetratricopeptide repeat-containing serine protease family protein [Oscillatoria sp. HE19RPO]